MNKNYDIFLSFIRNIIWKEDRMNISYEYLKFFESVFLDLVNSF